MTSEEVAARLDADDIPGALIALAATAETIAEAMRKKFIRNAVIMAMLLLVAVAGLVIGIGGWRATNSANHDRDAARISACAQWNRAIQANADADKAGFRDFIDYLVSLSPRPVDPKLIARANRTQDGKIQRRADLPPLHRDCSPQGIATYLATP